MANWKYKGLAEWVEGNTAFLSVVFSWNLQAAYMRAVWLRSQGYYVRAGGPAIILNPDYLSDIADTSGKVDALCRHNSNATFTTRGCIRKCKFCAVPIIEGDLIELSEWEPMPIVCDNNLLAASSRHFDKVIDRLKPLQGIDFNQGLDARLLTAYHASRLSELDLHAIRLAWDHIKSERQVIQAIEILRHAGIPKNKIKVYVLLGFNDTPDDALYRLETLWGMGIFPFPMRYQPLNTQKRNEYIPPDWTDRELKRYMRYWSRLRFVGSIPFKEFVN